jgi:hypothetical protein
MCFSSCISLFTSKSAVHGSEVYFARVGLKGPTLLRFRHQEKKKIHSKVLFSELVINETHNYLLDLIKLGSKRVTLCVNFGRYFG